MGGKFCVCEVEQFFDEDFDGTLCKVSKVLQVFDTKEAADYAEGLFYPGNYDVDGPAIRVVAEADLLKTFR
ncbi:hypothetical protein LCALLHIG_00010 [Klebsiella phage vB_KppS-Raw]|nr:hypothetical protein LCALLHIG_00010 [Klebsiella phage vB_KppS-Raw]CAD5235867.1 hypothetical protein OPBIHMGG_00018 [Klebsiella phage vB_KppS-Eggy]